MPNVIARGGRTVEVKATVLEGCGGVVSVVSRENFLLKNRGEAKLLSYRISHEIRLLIVVHLEARQVIFPASDCRS
jgi:hypothetical protein